MLKQLMVLCLAATFYFNIAKAEDLPATAASVEASVVGIGIYNRLSKPTSKLIGTGFVVGDGELVATNAHVVSVPLNSEQRERFVVFVGTGNTAKKRHADVVEIDNVHDLALLKIEGPPLKPLPLSDSKVRIGDPIAFTGFPLGDILGLYPATHQGIVAGIPPIATPAKTAKDLTIKQLKLLKRGFKIYQLDAIAYPGNSGSPVYNPETGEVIAIINKVYVKSVKEAALTNPSAITYAIPVTFLKKLIDKRFGVR